MIYNISIAESCDKPVINSATFSPDTDTVFVSEAYTINCETGYTSSDSVDASFTCQDTGAFDPSDLPTCTSK